MDINNQAAMLVNMVRARAELITDLLSTRRNIDLECQYPATISLQDYHSMYERLGPATRVVRVVSDEAWQVQMEVYEDEDENKTTPFEVAVKDLNRQLRGEKSWYRGKSGSPVGNYLRRVDQVSGIGHYGTLLLGLSDGKELSEPVTPSRDNKLLFLRVFSEADCPIKELDTARKTARFGLPKSYEVRFTDPATGLPEREATEVHWSRMIHVPGNLEGSEVEGIPRQQPVFNNLLDLKKLYGGSAEMYWRGAFPGISFEKESGLHPDDIDLEKEEFREEVKRYMLGLQRFLILVGMNAKSLSPQVVEPTAQIRAHIEAICIQLGIPIRVFMGSERGEAAAMQDDEAWNDRLRDHEYNYLTPHLVMKFYDRLINLGVLPEPEGYDVYWPDISSQSKLQKADIAMKRTSALQQYVTGNIHRMVPPMDYLTRVLEFTQAEAKIILRNALKAANKPRKDGVITLEDLMDLAAMRDDPRSTATRPSGARPLNGSNKPVSRGTPPAPGNSPQRLGR